MVVCTCTYTQEWAKQLIYWLLQVGIDLIGPLPLTENGNRYIVTLADYFLKWSVAACTTKWEWQICLPFLVQDDVQVSMLCSVFFIPVLHKMHITVPRGTSSNCLSINVAGIWLLVLTKANNMEQIPTMTVLLFTYARVYPCSAHRTASCNNPVLTC